MPTAFASGDGSVPTVSSRAATPRPIYCHSMGRSIQIRCGNCIWGDGSVRTVRHHERCSARRKYCHVTVAASQWVELNSKRCGGWVNGSVPAGCGHGVRPTRSMPRRRATLQWRAPCPMPLPAVPRWQPRLLPENARAGWGQRKWSPTILGDRVWPRRALLSALAHATPAERWDERTISARSSRQAATHPRGSVICFWPGSCVALRARPAQAKSRSKQYKTKEPPFRTLLAIKSQRTAASELARNKNQNSCRFGPCSQ